MDPHTGEDLGQTVLVALLAQARRGTWPERLVAWLYRATRNAAIDHMRRRGPRPIPLATEAEEGRLRSRLPDPRFLAEVREACVCGLERLLQLPRPHGQIAILQCLECKGARIVQWLRIWRRVSPEHGRSLIRRTSEMRRAMESGQDVRKRWRRLYGKKNPWNGSDPPPLDRL